jgi:imidazolonepropionase-like amidohydrolase
MNGLASILLFLPAAAGGSDPAPATDTVVIAAEVLHVGNGEVVRDALVTVSDGKIRSVTSGRPPDGALFVEGAHLTPGLIDCYSYMGVGAQTVEHADEITPSYKLARTAELDSPAFRRAVEEGVTTAFLSPESLNIFAGLGAVVKTAGGASADLFAAEGSAAQVLEDGAALKISLGGEISWRNSPPRFQPPQNIYSRRPNTRMAGVWAVRNEFYRAKEYAKQRKAGKVGADADLDVLVAAMEGRMPVRFLARRSHDIQTALRLQREFNLRHILIEEGNEAYLVPGLLAAAGVPVAAGPAYDVVSRSVAQGPTLDELRLRADPAPICCEHLGPEDYGFEHHEDEHGVYELKGLSLDLMLLALPRYDDAAMSFTIGRRQEGGKSTPALARLLSDAGVACALGAGEAHDGGKTETSVIHQARTAVAWGLAPEAALRMITEKAAALCYAQERVGTVETGKDADLVVWSGPPLNSQSRPLFVIVDGKVVVDSRPAATPD